MTPPDFDAMTGPELAAEAARCMGWTQKRANSQRWYDADGVCITAFAFDPANDLNHAGEFGAAFLEKFPSVSFRVTKHSASVFRAYLFTELGPAWRADHASEARARTVSILKAWTALNDA